MKKVVILKSERRREGAAKPFFKLVCGLVIVCEIVAFGCSSSDPVATLEIVNPDSRPLTKDKDTVINTDIAGFQYNVKAVSKGLPKNEEVELLLDEKRLEVKMPSDDGEILFKDVTLQPGRHRLQVKTITGSVRSEEITYTLITLDIQAPTNGPTIRKVDYSEGSTDSIQFTVVVSANGIGITNKVALYINGEKKGEETPDSESKVTFYKTTFPTGSVTVQAKAEIEGGPIVTSEEYTVTVVENCAWIDFVTPKPSSPGTDFLLGPADDTIGEKCGNDDFGITVAISTDAGHKHKATLFVDNSPSGEGEIKGTIATFDNVKLDATTLGQHTMRVFVENIDEETCIAEYPQKLVVDCKGITCERKDLKGYHIEGGECVQNQVCTPTSCAGHGVCSDNSSGVVSCDCNTGYTGRYCEECDKGYHKDGGDCVANKSCDDPDPCGDHGTCIDTSGEIFCACAKGYIGSTCSSCAAGFHEDQTKAEFECTLDTYCLPTTCAGHGACSAASGTVKCACYSGYTGAYCDGPCAEGYHSAEGNCVADQACEALSCGSHGDCNDTGGVVTCSCDRGYWGDTCGRCAAGFHNIVDGGLNCVLDETCLSNSCSGHEVTNGCAVVNGVVTCTCKTGYTGTYCEGACAAGYHASGNECVANEQCETAEIDDLDQLCNARGTCIDTTGVAVCTCTAVGYAGNHCETCASGFNLHGTNCDISCDTANVYCGFHGVCKDNSGPALCACDDGYYGANCQLTGTTCVTNETCASNPCLHAGTCTEDNNSDGLVQCECAAGYAGNKCEKCAPGYHDDAGNCVADTACGDNTCEKSGSCTAGTSITCSCYDGYTGTRCENCATGYHKIKSGICAANRTCSGFNCETHGTCTYTNGDPRCNCDAGYAGEKCEKCAAGYHNSAGICVIDSSCSDLTCSARGDCVQGGSLSCSCYGNYGGTKCESCKAGTHSICETCKSLGVQCGTWDDGCGGQIICGPCPQGSVCDEYWGICANDICDLVSGCCNNNTVYNCRHLSGVNGINCANYDSICGWDGNINLPANGEFWCVSQSEEKPSKILTQCPNELIP